MYVKGTAGFNLLPDGTIVLSGDHSPGANLVPGAPWEAAGVTTERVDVGDYRVRGPNVAWPDGWRTSIARDDNDELTIRVKLSEIDGSLRIQCTDPSTGEPKDIVYMLTVRVAIEGDTGWEYPPLDTMAPPIGLPPLLS